MHFVVRVRSCWRYGIGTRTVRLEREPPVTAVRVPWRRTVRVPLANLSTWVIYSHQKLTTDEVVEVEDHKSDVSLSKFQSAN